jgi:thiol-disulfide isomerase/thioredoxin
MPGRATVTPAGVGPRPAPVFPPPVEARTCCSDAAPVGSGLGRVRASRRRGLPARSAVVVSAAVLLGGCAGWSPVGQATDQRTAAAGAPQGGSGSLPGTGRSTSSTGSGSVAAQPYPLGISRFAGAQRRPLPGLAAVTLAGPELDVTGLRGSIVVLNFWASWCEPCRTDSPALVDISTGPAGRGARFVGVDELDATAAAQSFLASVHSPYPHLVDADGRLLARMSAFVPAGAVPSTVLVDRSGRVAARVIGPVTGAQLTVLLDELRTSG